MSDRPKLYLHRDISWLSFNFRVLQEAMDQSVPLFERIKFLAIYSSNLDSVKDYDVPSDTDNDYYRIELWKSDDMERKVLKQYGE